MLGNGLVLQNLLHMQLAQQQLLHLKDKHINNVSPVCDIVCTLYCSIVIESLFSESNSYLELIRLV